MGRSARGSRAFLRVLWRSGRDYAAKPENGAGVFQREPNGAAGRGLGHGCRRGRLRYGDELFCSEPRLGERRIVPRHRCRRHRRRTALAGADPRGDVGTGARRAASYRRRDRKSTRLNSSHVEISYAVFCLKKKKKKKKVKYIKKKKKKTQKTKSKTQIN